MSLGKEILVELAKRAIGLAAEAAAHALEQDAPMADDEREILAQAAEMGARLDLKRRLAGA